MGSKGLLIVGFRAFRYGIYVVPKGTIRFQAIAYFYRYFVPKGT